MNAPNGLWNVVSEQNGVFSYLHIIVDNCWKTYIEFHLLYRVFYVTPLAWFYLALVDTFLLKSMNTWYTEEASCLCSVQVLEKKWTEI